MKVSELFEPEPARWGLRGDPFLWRAMSEQLAWTELPDTQNRLVGCCTRLLPS